MKNISEQPPVALTPQPLIRTVRNIFCQAMHLLILVFFVWIVIVYFKSPQTLVDLHHFLEPVTRWLTFFIPYIQWLVNVSHTPELTRAFTEMIYLCFILLFLNLFLAVSPVFSGIPKRKYLFSINGFADFLEENIFCKLSPSISLVSPSERLWGRGVRGRQFIEADSFKQIIVVYLKNAAVYYGFLGLAGFVFFPWVAFKQINAVNISTVPFWLAVVVFAYSQIRLIFELAVLLFPSFIKNKT